MSCVVCDDIGTAEILPKHLMFDNLRIILNADFRSVKVSLKPLEGYNFSEDYLHCPFCYKKLSEIKSFYFLLEEKCDHTSLSN